MSDAGQERLPGWPDDPGTVTPEKVDFEAVAHVLGNTCCWGGRSRRFYSLAQHAVFVSVAVEKLGGLNGDHRRVLSLHALLGDAGQAWSVDVGDTRSTAKAQERARRAVLEAAGLEAPLPEDWGEALRLVQRMAAAAVDRDLSDAGIGKSGSRAGDAGPLFPPLRERVRPLAPDRAAKRWLERFNRLRAGAPARPDTPQPPGSSRDQGK